MVIVNTAQSLILLCLPKQLACAWSHSEAYIHQFGNDNSIVYISFSAQSPTPSVIDHIGDNFVGETSTCPGSLLRQTQFNQMPQ